MIFEPRTLLPSAGNKYYNTKSSGGYSKAIAGKCKDTGKPYSGLNVLANCVGYAYGRFHEIAKDPTMSYLSPVNAEDFPAYAKKCKQGTEPKLGSVIVWKKGKEKCASDGAGHVAIVEKIISNNQIVISQSGYNSKTFWTETITKKNGTWLCNWMTSAYTFSCFIYNPVITDDTKTLLLKCDKGPYVKDLQINLNKLKYNLVADGIFGVATENAIKDFQKKKNLTIDGIVGEATYNAIDQELSKPDGVIDLSLLIDNKEKSCWATVINNQNYIRLADLTNIGLAKEVKYNSTKKIPEIKTK